MQNVKKSNVFIKFFRSCAALLLCCLIVFVSSYKKPVKVEAAVTAATVAGCVLVGVAVTALGIGVSAAMSNETYTQKCTDIWNGIPDSIRGTVSAVQGAGSVIKAQLTSAFLHAVSDGLAKEYPNLSLQDCNFDFAKYMNWDMSKVIVPSGYGWHMALAGGDFTNAYILSTGTLAVGECIDLGNASVNITNGGSTLLYKEVTVASGYDYNYFSGLSSSYIGSPYAAIAYTYDNSVWNYALITYENYSSGICVYPKTADSSVAPTVPKQDVYNPANENFFAQGYSALNHRVDDVISRIGALQGVQGGIAVTLSDAVGSLTAINDQIKALTQATVTGQDATDAKEKEADDTANKGRDTTVPKNPTLPDMTIPAAITKKFPFSIPWDLYNAVTVLASPGEAPKWTFPFGKASIQIDMAPYNSVASVVRWGLSLLFLIGLILITSKVIKH